MLNYIKYGNDKSKKYVVLIHSLCTNMHVFDKQLEYFKKDYNVILIDLPYHSGSCYYNKKLNFKVISPFLTKAS